MKWLYIYIPLFPSQSLAPSQYRALSVSFSISSFISISLCAELHLDLPLSPSQYRALSVSFSILSSISITLYREPNKYICISISSYIFFSLSRAPFLSLSRPPSLSLLKSVSITLCLLFFFEIPKVFVRRFVKKARSAPILQKTNLMKNREMTYSVVSTIT